MFFRAASATADVAIEHSDIEALRRAVEAQLVLASIDVQAMRWEDWLAVSVSGSGSRFSDHPHTGMGAELKIHVQRLKRGWHAATQRHVTIGRNGFVTDFPQPTEFKASETLRENNREWLIGSAKPQTAYIPDTPENMAALTDIQSRLAALQDRLMALLHQEAIRDSLSGLDSLLLPRSAQQ